MNVAASAGEAVRFDVVERAWGALRGVPDPEIPAISIVELGVVRGVEATAEGVRVCITPTYSGCPAMRVIEADVRTALAELALREVSIQTRLSPAWTTDWIAPEAKTKLRLFGIAPPGGSAPRIDVSGISPLRRQSSVACPRCASTATALVAQFGSTACKALYRCTACSEPFDYFKPF